MMKFEYQSIMPCTHSQTCSCEVKVTGIPGTPLQDLPPLIVGRKTKDEQCAEILAHVSARYKVVHGQILPSKCDEMADLLIHRLRESPNMKLVPPPFIGKAGFLETPAYDVPPIVRKSYMYADRQVLPKYYDQIDFKVLFSEEEQVDDYHMEIRRRSAYWTTFGTINGRPVRVAALKDATGLKTINAIMGFSRKTMELNPTAKEAVKHIDEALRRLYNAMGYTQEDLGKERSIISFSELNGGYLGSAAGLNPTSSKKTEILEGVPLIITSTGKKIDMLEHDYQRIMDYLTNDVPFETFWSLSGKVENYFTWLKQIKDEDWEALVNKMRLFNIPTSTFILAEKLVSKVRMIKERGNVIQIGMKWAHGGVDELAKILRVNFLNHYKKIIVEGDLKNMDQTVHSYFVKLYMDMMLVHETPGSLDYAMKEKLLQYIVPRIVQRLTRLYSDVWVVQYGGVPSGCFNTSHMDSWIMGLYFYLFCVMQLESAPDQDKVDLEELIEQVIIIVYGDDHLYNKGDTRVSHYLSGFNFQMHLKQTWDVDLKDIYDGLPFLSVVDKGRIKKRGACFLKQFFIPNPYVKSHENQPQYLPFREVNEFMARAAYGRESASRSDKEFLLAVVGHAYGTYGSNQIAYELLREAYVYASATLKLTLDQIPEIRTLYEQKSMRKIRQQGITIEQLLMGFPTMETLIKHNELCPGYHDTRKIEFLDSYNPDLPEEW